MAGPGFHNDFECALPSSLSLRFYDFEAFVVSAMQY